MKAALYVRAEACAALAALAAPAALGAPAAPAAPAALAALAAPAKPTGLARTAAPAALAATAAREPGCAEYSAKGEEGDEAAARVPRLAAEAVAPEQQPHDSVPGSTPREAPVLTTLALGVVAALAGGAMVAVWRGWRGRRVSGELI